MQHWRSLMLLMAVVASLALGISMIGCDGGDDGGADGTATARVVLTDVPMSNVQEVHVHIVRVEAVANNGGVQTLVTDDEIPDDIDLVALAANPLLMGEPLIPTGTYTQVRMILDDGPGENYVIDDEGTRHDLTIPSGAQSGAKLVTGAFTLTDGEVVTILMDFNAAASVHQAGQSGQWIMRPTIFASVVSGDELDLGSIEGTVLDEADNPLSVPADQVLGVFVETPFGAVAVAQVDSEDGSYEIPAMLAGDYDVRVRYADPLDWEPIGDPLGLVVGGSLEELVNVDITADQTLQLDIVVESTTYVPSTTNDGGLHPEG